MTVARRPAKSTVPVLVLILVLAAAAAACSGGKGPAAPAASAAGVSSEPVHPPLVPEDQVRKSNDPAKTEIFRDAGLGMFIHWGINSQVGTEISWPLFNASDDYIRKYYALADTFDPSAFDPSAWARLAKLAGMEYVCFTAKHHDGFCMFDTAYSDFKVTRTPYGRDVVAQVVEAFRREGMLVGLYYSPGDVRYQFETGARLDHIYKPGFDSRAPFGPRKLPFLDYERGHVEELLTRYGDIFMIWFDGDCAPLKVHAWRVKPDVFIGRGEIPTPEQEIPGKASDFAWESCMTTSRQWSYQPHADVRTPREVIWNLVRIRARGGNMLLNVGPRPDGRIAPPDEDLLRDLGLWMMLYGEAVRGVRPWTVTNEGDVWLTRRPSDGTVYAFADLKYGQGAGLEPQGRRIRLRSVRSAPGMKIELLSQAGDLEWTEDAQGLLVTVVRRQTIQLVTAPAAPGGSPAKGDASEREPITWGPDWPVAIKITGAKPAAR